MTPSNIRVLTYMYGNLPYFEESRKINSAYCLTHGYEYVIDMERPRSDRKVNWAKLPAILKHLTDCEYLLYIDADAVFYSHELKIEDEIIALMGGEDIIMTADVGCEFARWNPGRPNSGVIMMKNTPNTRIFIEHWNGTTDDHEDYRFNIPADERGLWNVTMPKYPLTVRTVKDYYRFNGHFGQYIRHFIGLPHEKRLEQMQQISKRLFQ